MSERVSTLVAVAILLVAGAASWGLQSRAPLWPQGDSLANIPLEIGSYRGVDSPVGRNVENMLRADFNLQREYVHPLGQVVWLYVGYYGTARGGTPEHTPEACYAAHGWAILDATTVVIDPATGKRAVEYLVQSSGQQQLVLFWYRSFRASGLRSTLALQADHVVGKLFEGRGDGALVRLSTPLLGVDRDGARRMLIGFAQALEPELAGHWPEEKETAPATASSVGRVFRDQLPAGAPWRRE